MPGANCALPGCGVSRNFEGIGIFQVPARKGEFYENWRKELLNVICKYRVVDKVLKERIDRGKLYIYARNISNQKT